MSIISGMQDIYNKFREFKSFEITFVNQDRELQRLFCTVKSIENNRIILGANNQTNRNIFASVGDELQLHIYTEQGVYSAKSRMLLVTKGIISTEYVISYPSHSKHSQRREYFRAEIPAPFKMKVFQSYDVNDFVLIDKKARNICGKGMSYLSERPFTDYSSIELEIFFENRVIATSADLVYTQPTTINGRPYFINAFTFTDILKGDIEFLIKQCFFHQLDLRRKSI